MAEANTALKDPRSAAKASAADLRGALRGGANVVAAAAGNASASNLTLNATGAANHAMQVHLPPIPWIMAGAAAVCVIAIVVSEVLKDRKKKQ
jgi:hypothetical protein